MPVHYRVVFDLPIPEFQLDYWRRLNDHTRETSVRSDVETTIARIVGGRIYSSPRLVSILEVDLPEPEPEPELAPEDAWMRGWPGVAGCTCDMCETARRMNR